MRIKLFLLLNNEILINSEKRDNIIYWPESVGS